MEASADDYLTKPFVAHELRTRLRERLRIIPFDLPEQDNIRLREENARLRRLLRFIACRFRKRLAGRP
jgi:DNA-binding response OmpR family regulator